MFTYQIRTKKPSKRWISNTPTRKETTHPVAQLPKKINNHLVTQMQIGDSQPFSPFELITMNPV